MINRWSTQPSEKHVGAGIDGALDQLFGSHVQKRPLGDSLLGFFDPLGGQGDAEVGELDLAAPRHEDIARRHVAVNHAEQLTAAVAGSVGVFEGVGHLDGDVQGQLVGYGAVALLGAGQEFFEVEAVDVLEHLKGQVVGVAVIEDSDDIGVVELAGDAGLVEKHVPQRGLPQGRGQ